MFGGWNGTNTLATVEKMNLNTGVVTLLTSLPFSRAQQAIAVYDDLVYLCSGRSGSQNRQSIYIYDKSTDLVTDWTYSVATSFDDEADPLDTPTTSGPDVVSPACYVDSADQKLVIIGGQNQDNSFSDKGYEILLGDSVMYVRETSIKRWGYLRPSTVFNGVAGEFYNVSISVRNADPVNDTDNPYFRIVVYIGPLTAVTRKIKLGYTVPPQKDSYGYYTYNLPFQLQAGETEFRVYGRHYSGGTRIDIGQIQVIKSQFSLTPVLQNMGRGVDDLTVEFREPVNNPYYDASKEDDDPFFTAEYDQDAFKFWTAHVSRWIPEPSTFDNLAGRVYVIDDESYGTNLQRVTGVFSPIWGCQMDITIKLFDFDCKQGLDLDAAEVWYEASEDVPTPDPITGFATYAPNGRMYMKYRLKNIWYEETLFQDIQLNHSKLNREFRRDKVAWFIETWRGIIKFGFYFYGRLKIVELVSYYTGTVPAYNGLTGGYTGVPAPENYFYDTYSFRCYGLSSSGSGVFMRASRNLSTIIQDLCERSGIAASEIDTGGVTGSVTGYLAANKSSVKSYIDPLKQAYMFDMFDSEKLVFRARNNTVLDAIDVSELIASENSHPLTIDRLQEKDLPNRVSVVYIDEDRKYENNTQYAYRSEEYGQGDESLTVPVVMTADDAAQVADKALVNKWSGRVKLSFAVTHEKLYWEVGDVIQIVNANKTYTVMLTDLEDVGDKIKCDAVNVGGIALTSDATGDSGLIPVEELSVYKRSILLQLDVPIVREQDDDAGFYYAVYHDNTESGKWSGANVSRSQDNGTTWQALAFFQNSATYGQVTTVIPAPARFTLWDDATKFTVVMKQGALSSDTKENVLLNGTPLAVVGDEIIAFTTATLTAADTYEISGLLRGLFGTEDRATGHGINDRFVLLDINTISRYNPGLNDINKSRLYRAASIFTDADAADQVSFTNLAVGLRPYSVVHEKGLRSGNDIQLSWVRRSRIGGQWNDGSDIPLAEDSEQYEIDIFSTADEFKRTVTVNSPAYIYTESTHLTDFGSIQGSVKFVIYQMSGQVGRGFRKEVIA